MPVNLMQGKMDGDENNSKNTIDLKLEKVSSPVQKTEAKPTISEKPVKHPEVREIKVKVPSDIHLKSDLKSNDGGSFKIVAGIVALLVVASGALLFLLNAESQDLRGSINVLPETNSTQIVDDILAEDFSNGVNGNSPETEQVEVETQVSSDTTTSNNESVELEITEASEVNDELALSVEIEAEVQEPIVIDTSSIVDQGNGLENPEIAESNVAIESSDIISEYNLQNSAATTTELLTGNSSNSSNDFTQDSNEQTQTVAEEVLQSEEIQGETGPGLWISVILATILSYAYAKRNEKQLG